MPIPHVFEKIKGLDMTDQGCYVYLGDGTSFGIPPVDAYRYKEFKVGDEVLLNFGELAEKGRSMLRVYRGGRDVYGCLLGIGGIHLESPAFEEFGIAALVERKRAEVETAERQARAARKRL